MLTAAALTGIRRRDTLTIACDPFPVTVVRADSVYAYVTWPWRTPDPDSMFGWDGTRAIATDPAHPDFAQQFWRVETGPEPRVWIPPTRVKVRSVETYAEPRDVGSLPRPVLGLHLVPADVRRPGPDDGDMLHLDAPEPIRLERA